MKTPTPSRRVFLRAGGALGGAWLLAGRGDAAVRVLSRWGDGEDEADADALVVVELVGGNDGLSTIVPYADDGYLAARQRLRVDPATVLKLDEYRGLNPTLGGLRSFFDTGRMAIVEGVGYPNPNRSHFTSFDIWHAGDPAGRLTGSGWIGRALEALYGEDADPNRAFVIGRSLPFSFNSDVQVASCFESAGSYRRLKGEEAMVEEAGAERGDALGRVRSVFRAASGSSSAVRQAVAAYTPRVEYPDSGLGEALRTVAALIQGRVGARVLNVSLDGFDTHVHQPDQHAELLSQLDGALSAFLADLQGTPRGRRTLVLVYSEFGRRVEENASDGTDHGTAGPVFLLGERVKGGLYGAHPSLVELDEGDLIFNTDFRSIYATILRDWLRVEPTRVLSGEFPILPLLA